MLTSEQKEALVRVLNCVGEVIRDAGEQGAPAGIVYAALMHAGCTLQQFQGLITILKKMGKVREENHVLYWIDNQTNQK